MKRYLAGNSIKSVIDASQQTLKQGKYPIINYAVEYNTKDLYRTNEEYHKLSKILDPKSKVALKLSSLNFETSLIHDTVKRFIYKNIQVVIDAEENANNDIYHSISNELILGYNEKKCNILKTYQMYRKDSLDQLRKDIHLFNSKDIVMGTKIVRGAYWNAEHNEGHLYTKKEDTDANYNYAIIELFNNADTANFRSENILATHNLHSIQYANKLNNYFQKPIFNFAHLKGMQEEEYSKLSQKAKVYVYLPYGPYRKMVPYLTRRLYENIDSVKYLI